MDFVVVDQRKTWAGLFTPKGKAEWHAAHVAPALRRGVKVVVVLRRLFDHADEMPPA